MFGKQNNTTKYLLQDLTAAVHRVADAIEQQTAHMAQLDEAEEHGHEDEHTNPLEELLSMFSKEQMHDKMLQDALDQIMTGVLGEGKLDAKPSDDQIERVKREFHETTGHTAELKWLARHKKFGVTIGSDHGLVDDKPQVSKAEKARRSKIAKKAAATRKHNKSLKEDK